MATMALRPTADIVRRQVVDRTMGALLCLSAIVALTPLALVIGYVLANGLAGINLDLLTKLPKPVGELGGGMANAFLGTLIVILLASIMGVPIGMLAGIFLSEMGNNHFASVLRFLTDVLTGVPSIVIGIVAYTLIVVPMHSFSALAGGVALALIMIPVVTRTTEEALRRVPQSLREASLGLGVLEWKTTLFVVVPSGIGGIVTGIMLAVARISGETAPLLFTAFGSRFWPDGLNKPIAAAPLQIFQYAVAPYKDWHSQAWAAAFLLMLLILGLNIGVRVVTRTGFQRIR
ncbi:MAG TPA: phosphate ABC transporter permease PstA [Chloroflexota bacterium]|nr:phosphate ABC transporter permease PstA [Chloroflexota bacterium]